MKKNDTRPVNCIGRGFPGWAQVLIRIPFLLLLACETARSRFAASSPRYTIPCRTVSIVIPTRNEETCIETCIRSVAKSRYVSETIVVDAASTDQTVRLARQAGARVLIHARPIEKGGGRGGQIRAGIHAASGDIVAVVHADTLLSADDIDRMVDVLNNCPDVAGGAVGGHFDCAPHRLRWIELANHFRAGFFKISFGDQVQFFRRVPVVAPDLFPNIPIMEDVEFSIRLHRIGRRTYLFGNAVASPRRWDRKGYRNAFWVMKTVLVYLLDRLSGPPETAGLYRRYYRVHDTQRRFPCRICSFF